MIASKRLSIILVAVLFLQIFLYGVRWVKANVLTADFPYFYLTARLWQTGKDPYDPEEQCWAQAALRPSSPCAGNAHTPALLQIWSLVWNENYVASYWRWSGLLLMVLLTCFLILYSLSKDHSHLLKRYYSHQLSTLWFGTHTHVSEPVC